MGSSITEGTNETLSVILSDIPVGGSEVDIVVVLKEIFGTAGGDVTIINHIHIILYTHD